MTVRVLHLSSLALLVWMWWPAGTAVRAQGGTTKGEWRGYGGDAGGTKYAPLDQVTRDNLANLEIVWRWPSADQSLQKADPLLRASRYEDTPLMVNGVLYTVTPLGLIAALDPATGQTKWVYDPESYKSGKPTNVGYKTRGLAYWTDGVRERLLHATGDMWLVSIDAKTGKPDPAFGTSGRADLMVEIRGGVRALTVAARAPTVAGDVVIVGNTVTDGHKTKETPPGHVHGFDVRTGKRLWTFHVVPKPGEFGYESWLEGAADYSGNSNVWAGTVYDPELGYVYMPSSTPTNSYYGGHRPGDNLFAETLVCVDAKTGKRIWHFQTTHHGIWEYDLPAPPVLGDFVVQGRRVKAVMQVSKQGFTYVFDRKTGQPVWPIEERPVPKSTIPRERSAPTQPFPTKPPAFSLQGSTEQNVIEFTPELRKKAIEQLQEFDHGPLFTPPTERGTLNVPGSYGGANWGGAGFDPETGMLYVPGRMTMQHSKVLPQDPKGSEFLFYGGGRDHPAMYIDGLPIMKPPYATVTAYNMNRGEIAWQTAIGNGPRNHPLLKGLTLPPLGDDIWGGAILVTKTLLFVSVTHLNYHGQPAPPPWREWGDPDIERKALYVFDKGTGAQLRVMEIQDGGAAPMTYLHQGRQYIVVAARGGENSELVAFALKSRE